MSVAPSPATADAVVAALHPCGRSDRDGTSDCWIVAVSSGRGGGATDAATPLSVRYLARTADGRVAGRSALLAPDADLTAWVDGCRAEVAASRDDALTRRRMAADFVHALQMVGSQNGHPGEARRVDRELANAAGMARRLRAEGVWDGPEEDLARACVRRARLLSSTWRRFLSRLDRKALRICTEDPQLNALVGECWSGLDASVDPGRPLAIAMEAAPSFRRQLAEGWVREPDRVRRAVAEGSVRALVDALLVEQGHLPRRLVRAAHACDAVMDAAWLDDSGPMADRRGSHVATQGRPTEAVRRLIHLPPSWVPSDDAEWRAYLDLCDVHDLAAGWVEHEADRPRLFNAGGRWVAYRDRLRAAAGREPPAVGGDPVDVLHAVLGVDDFAAAYAAQVLAPAAAAATGAEPDLHSHGLHRWSTGAQAMLTSCRSLPRILEASRRWHGRQDAMRAEVARLAGREVGDGSWPPGFPDARIGEVWLKVLLNEVELVAEGARTAADGVEGLDHCVGGHVARCRHEGARVLSVRRVAPDGTWSRLSTAELLVEGDPGDGPVHVSQHRGRSNSGPPDAAVAALEGYLAMVADGRLAVDRPALVPAEPRHTVEELGGFDWRDEGVRAAVAALWDGLVPGPLAGLGAAELWEVGEPLVLRHAWGWLPELPVPRPIRARDETLPARVLPCERPPTRGWRS